MHRFLIKNIAAHSQTLHLEDPQEIHHLKHVLRLKPPQKITVFDGLGQEVLCEIQNINESQVQLKTLKRVHKESHNLSIILACAIPKKSKFETIIEKCTELGVDAVIPLTTKRTEVILKGERAHKKHIRYQAVAINAAKQSQRVFIPRIYPVTEFSRALAMKNSKDLGYIPCLEGKRTSVTQIPEDIKKNTERLFFFVGPEGDFTSQEVQQAVQKGFHPLSLGATTLKVDTAAIAVCAFASLFIRNS